MQTERVIAGRNPSASASKMHIMTCPDYAPENIQTPAQKFQNPTLLYSSIGDNRQFLTFTKRTIFGLAYSLVIATAVLKSSWVWLIGNKIAQKIDYVPSPGIARQIDRLPVNLPDSLLENKALIEKILWGKEPDPKNLLQNGIPNCQIMGAIQSQYLTPELLELLKNSSIEVTSFELAKKKFRLNSVVHLNGIDIEVPFEEIEKWMSQCGITTSESKDGALAIPILTYAVEKVLTENFERQFPPTVPSSAPILLTGNDYVVMGVSPYVLNSLSDDEFTKVLKNAPNSPVLIASWGSFDDFTHWIKKKFSGIYKPFELSPPSEHKAAIFRQSTLKRAIDLSKDSPTATNAPSPPRNIEIARASTGTPGKAAKEPPETYPDNHIFAVKGYNEKEDTILLIDCHGVEYPPLKKDLARKLMWGVITERKNTSTFTFETFTAYLTVLASIYALRHSSKYVEKKLAL